MLDDFEDGGLGGWAPPRANTSNIAGGPTGSSRALEVRPGGKLAAFDAGADISGAVDPEVVAIEIDMMRGVGAAPLDIRLVLFGPGAGNRWTSTVSQVLLGDGLWDTYRFSIRESDLTQVAGGDDYADLLANLDRIMFRHDTEGPSARGTPVEANAGPFFIDNVTAVASASSVPEPGTALLVALGVVGLVVLRRKRWSSRELLLSEQRRAV